MENIDECQRNNTNKNKKKPIQSTKKPTTTTATTTTLTKSQPLSSTKAQPVSSKTQSTTLTKTQPTTKVQPTTAFTKTQPKTTPTTTTTTTTTSTQPKANNTKTLKEIIDEKSKDLFKSVVPRATLLKNFKDQRQNMETKSKGSKTPLMTKPKSSFAKEFCFKSGIDMKPIFIKDMYRNTIHYNRVFIGRVIAKPIKTNSVQILLEDQNCGDTEVLMVSISNIYLPGSDFCAELDAIYPVGAVVAIKEPYLRHYLSGEYFISIDDPQDLELIIDPIHPHLTHPEWIQWLHDYMPKDIDGEDGWRVRGNRAYTTGDYDLALKYYNGGLTSDPQHSTLALNKLAALVALKRYHECIPIGINLLTTLQENEKLCTRLGKSYYQVGLYENSMDIYQYLLEFMPHNTEATEAIEKCKERMVERDQGVYNFKKLRDQEKINNEQDCSEYIGPLEIKRIPGKGRGLVVTKDIPAGTLLIASKGVGILDEKVDNIDFLKTYVGDGKVLTLASLDIVSKVKNNIRTNPHLCHQLSKLYAGKEFPNKGKTSIDDFKSTIETVFSNKPAPSVEQIKRIVQLNSFKLKTKCGVWLLPSLINHSCLPNSTRFCIGETLFITATRNLKQGEEVLMSYVPLLDFNFLKRIFAFSKYDFVCDCQLCQLENLESTDSVLERDTYFQKFQKELAPRAMAFDAKVFSLVEKNIQAIKMTFNNSNNKNMHPTRGSVTSESLAHTRQMAIDIFQHLTSLGLLSQRYPEKAFPIYLECVRILGFDWELDYTKEKLQDTPYHFKVKYRGSFDGLHTDLLMQVYIHSFLLGYQTLARQALALSRLCGQAYHGYTVLEHEINLKASFPVSFRPKDTIELIEQ
ncbi:hypothetical protein CYY_006180 [Polysphondylium violaceum]|uniref:SET domain-containing protein n=1 Tax=Polysphondylium violaceum TaxID=133409 RepID=A0A8J4PQZ1_9MYCE|nr:hypothetical protein CYY_006180 [Polysphondylium violaceum]